MALGHGLEADVDKHVTGVVVSKAEVAGDELVGDVFQNFHRLVRTGRQVVDCGDLDGGRVDMRAVVIAVIDLEAEGGVGITELMDVREETQGGDLGCKDDVVVFNDALGVADRAVAIVILPECTSGGGLEADGEVGVVFRVGVGEVFQLEGVELLFVQIDGAIGGSRGVIHGVDVDRHGVVVDAPVL